MLARIAADQPFNAHQDARSTDLVLECVDPPRLRIGLVYSHDGNVAHGLHVSMAGFFRVGSGHAFRDVERVT